MEGSHRAITTALAIPLVIILLFLHSYSVDATSRYQTLVRDIVGYLKSQKVKASEDRLRAIARHVLYESKRRNVDYRLVLALMKVESNFRHDAVSPKGAIGLLQIRPVLGRKVARDMGLELKHDADLHAPDKNIAIGTYHLSRLIRSFKSIPSALQAYNKGVAGARAERSKRIAPNARFTNAVMEEYSKTLSLLPAMDDAPP
jgi:soluble lytic murein transglycosylase